MGQTAILSGMYEELREYAELLDDVLMELKAGVGQPASERRKKLGRFLTEVSSARTSNLTARLIGLLLKRQGRVTQDELARIGGHLGSAAEVEMEPAEITRLEELARSLEQEQAVAMARMQGRQL